MIQKDSEVTVLPRTYCRVRQFGSGKEHAVRCANRFSLKLNTENEISLATLNSKCATLRQPILLQQAETVLLFVPCCERHSTVLDSLHCDGKQYDTCG